MGASTQSHLQKVRLLTLSIPQANSAVCRSRQQQCVLGWPM